MFCYVLQYNKICNNNYTWHFNIIVNIHYFNLLQYTEIHFNSNHFNLTVHGMQYTAAL
jgi:hypothetical protein